VQDHEGKPPLHCQKSEDESSKDDEEFDDITFTLFLAVCFVIFVIILAICIRACKLRSKRREQNKVIYLTKIVDKHMPVTIYDASVLEFDDNTCCICLEELAKGERVRKLVCGHVFQ
jgi:hypothetical protein